MSEWGVPTGGYTAPPQAPYQFADPLISANYNGWWGRGLSIAKRGWKSLAALQAIGVVMTVLVHAPTAAFVSRLFGELDRALTSDPDTPPDLTPLFGLLGFVVLTQFLALIVAAVVTIATVHVGLSVAMGARPRVIDALRLAGQRVFPLVGWQLLAFPIYLVAVCLCVLPVFYVAAVFLVLPVVVAAERTNAVRRCFSLFHRDLGTSVGRAATIIGLTIGATLAGSMAGTLFDVVANATLPGGTGSAVRAVGSTLVAALIGGAIAVMLAPLTLAAYADMRSHVEPQLTTDQIATSLGIARSAARSATPTWPTWPAPDR